MSKCARIAAAARRLFRLGNPASADLPSIELLPLEGRQSRPDDRARPRAERSRPAALRVGRSPGARRLRGPTSSNEQGGIWRSIPVALAAAGLALAATPAAAGPNAEKAWVKQYVKRMLNRSESEIAAMFAPLTEPLHADIPYNTELTLAHVGDDLAIVANCMRDGAGDMWAGMFVISAGEEFAVPTDTGAQVPADALGFFVRWTGALQHPTRANALIVNGERTSTPGLIDRVATTTHGETFFFEPWTIVYADGCEITATVTFGTNGSDVLLLPEGEEPLHLPTQDEGGSFAYVDGELISSWKEERFPWLPE